MATSCPSLIVTPLRDPTHHGPHSRLPLDRQAVLDPVLLAAGVDQHPLIAEVLETPGDDVGVDAGAAAVHDDLDRQIGQQPRGQPIDLIVRAPEPVSVTRLTDLLWGDDPPKNPDNALQTQISYLRKALTPAGGPPLIVTEAGGYALAVEPDQIDARRFEALVRSTDEDIAEHEDGGDPYAAIAALDD